jgi:hypothetical protein
MLRCKRADRTNRAVTQKEKLRRYEIERHHLATVLAELHGPNDAGDGVATNAQLGQGQLVPQAIQRLSADSLGENVRDIICPIHFANGN